MTSGVHAPTPNEPRHGDAVIVNGRAGTFLYRRGAGAVVRFEGEGGTRVVPHSKVRRRA